MSNSLYGTSGNVSRQSHRGDDQAALPDTKVGWIRRSLSLLLPMVAGVCFWNGLPDRLADDARQAVVADAQAAVRDPQSRSTAPDVSLKTTPIQDIRVGQRVLAHNPEVSKEERESWVEPDWSDWQLVRLEMPKPDGSLLNIEMLRPTEWLESQAGVVVESREIIAHPGPLEGQGVSAEGQGHDTGPSVAESATDSVQPLDSQPSSLDPFQPMPLVPESIPVGLVVEMDLPELGLTDLAWVTDLEDCPEIESGDGRVVTATFHHSSGDVIDLAVDGAESGRSASQPETIGTTSNHPFRSVDRQEYVQAGQLDVGERVVTFSGDTKRIVGKLPRPGPQPVYNLEVHAEHTYFVGQDGVLVHNSNRYSRNTAAMAADEAVENGALSVKHRTGRGGARPNEIGDTFKYSLGERIRRNKNVANVEYEVPHLVTSNGRVFQRRVDIRVTHTDGRIFYIEAKAGNSPRNLVQEQLDRLIREHEGIPSTVVRQQR